MGLDAFVLGCGGMMPLPGRHLASTMLRREGELFLFDCGEGTQVALKKLNLKWKHISAIFISHTHADHITGLPGLMMLSSQVDRTEPLHIFGPPKIAAYVQASMDTLDMFINYPVEVHELPIESATIFEGDGFSVRSFPLVHTKPCLGYVFEEHPRPGLFHPEKALELGLPKGPLWGKLQKGESVSTPDGRVVEPAEVLGPARKGIRFAFATDTMYLPSIAPEVAEADLFICEGMFGADRLDDAKKKRHMTVVQTATIARDAKVKRLGIIHYSPRYNDYELRDLLKQAREVFADSFLTRDGMHIPLQYED